VSSRRGSSGGGRRRRCRRSSCSRVRRIITIAITPPAHRPLNLTLPTTISPGPPSHSSRSPAPTSTPPHPPACRTATSACIRLFPLPHTTIIIATTVPLHRLPLSPNTRTVKPRVRGAIRFRSGPIKAPRSGRGPRRGAGSCCCGGWKNRSTFGPRRSGRGPRRGGASC
jgi:hypothetical protein